MLLPGELQGTGMRFDFSSGCPQLGVMHNRLARAMVALMLVLAVGGHWFCIQSVAWVGMFTKFSQTCSFTEALVKTFNGQYPCKLCLVVQQGRKSEQKQDSVKVETKLDLFILDRQIVHQRPSSWTRERFPVYSELAPERFERPPTPPPRHA